MILPRLCINGSRYRVELYDPKEPNNTIIYLSNQSPDVITDLFANMLYMTLENYDDGYDIGYDDAIQDFEEGGGLDVEI